MTINHQEAEAFNALHKVMNEYSPISDSTWRRLKIGSAFRCVPKHHILYPCSEILHSFSFAFSGLFRVYISDEKGNEYNKNFFEEDSFPGSMSALLTASPSKFSIQSLEPSCIIEIDFKIYRSLLIELDDLKLFHIHYLEKNWLLAKDAREVELVQENATQRYQRFLKEYPRLNSRISQFHIASHLGITPTQLSRIRKKIEAKLNV